MNTKEEKHKSRNQIGFHFFLSRYIYDFCKLSLQEQRRFFPLKLSINLFPRYNSSINSTSSLIDEKGQTLLYHKTSIKSMEKIV